MMKKENYLEIMDWKGERVKTTIDLNKLEKIQKIEIEIISGDEICTIQYKNGKREKFDSSKCRMQGFYDGEYTLYDVLDSTNLIDRFIKRKNSYSTLNYFNTRME